MNHFIVHHCVSMYEQRNAQQILLPNRWNIILFVCEQMHSIAFGGGTRRRRRRRRADKSRELKAYYIILSILYEQQVQVKHILVDEWVASRCFRASLHAYAIYAQTHTHTQTNTCIINPVYVYLYEDHWLEPAHIAYMHMMQVSVCGKCFAQVGILAKGYAMWANV